MAFAVGDRVYFLYGVSSAGEPGDIGVVLRYQDDFHIEVKNELSGQIGNKYARNLEVVERKGSNMTFGNLVEKAKFLALSAEDKALVKQRFQTPDGEPTAAGLSLLQKLNWEANKKGLVELASEMDAYDKAEKKA
jgi:hypothetical protein